MLKTNNKNTERENVYKYLVRIGRIGLNENFRKPAFSLNLGYHTFLMTMLK